jgi:hypothetical protein
MGCDDCWICRHSYPDSIIITSLEGYTPYCPDLIGTFATAAWGQKYGSLLLGDPVEHYSFGTTDAIAEYSAGKPKCIAAWFGSCDGGAGSEPRLWSIYLFAGTLNPFPSSAAGGEIRSGNVAATRLDAFVRIDQYHFTSVLCARREEHFRVDLPKPCPDAGIYGLSPVGTPDVIDPGGCIPAYMDTLDFLHEVEVEIVA